VFEPYFTTKAEGTGLGLPLVLDNVTRAGGTLELDSTVARGTTVRAVLPIVTGLRDPTTPEARVSRGHDAPGLRSPHVAVHEQPFVSRDPGDAPTPVRGG